MKKYIGILILFAILVTELAVVRQTVFPNTDFLLTRETVAQLRRAPDPEAVVAQVDGECLTNGVLQVYYWAAVAAYTQAPHAEQPDLRVPLCVQRCPLTDSGESWEDYFLAEALNTWHTAQALVLQGGEDGLPTEALYDPDPKLHAKNLTDKPATAVLYGCGEGYRLNSLHAAYIDSLPALMEEGMAQAAFGTDEASLLQAAELYNRGYSYYTALTRLTQRERVTATSADTGERCVTFRQVLLHPAGASLGEDGAVTASEKAWKACEKQARSRLEQWSRYFLCTEGTFGQMAYTESADGLSRERGGLYEEMLREQVPTQLGDWLFDPLRREGDTAMITSDYGVHLLYFREAVTLEQLQRERADTADAQQAILTAAKTRYPMTVDKAAAVLQQGDGTVGWDALLYPDIAHEHYPEMPLYLQHDYGDFTYGGYPLTTHGCGICSLAMVTTYVTDTEWTPTQLSGMFGDYCSFMGTDVCLFWQALAEVDYYFKGYVYKDAQAWAALEAGYPIIVRENKGYWTRGCGHYITLEKLTEEGKVVVRDSSILNMGKLEGHAADAFDWEKVTGQAAVYLVFGQKVTRHEGCVRCGSPDAQTAAMVGTDYTCPKCREAMLRRETYLNQ